MIERRSPHQVGKEISKGINEGRINFFDKHLSMFPVDLVYVSLSECWGTMSRWLTKLTNFRDFTQRTGQTTTWMLLS